MSLETGTSSEASQNPCINRALPTSNKHKFHSQSSEFKHVISTLCRESNSRTPAIAGIRRKGEKPMPGGLLTQFLRLLLDEGRRHFSSPVAPPVHAIEPAGRRVQPGNRPWRRLTPVGVLSGGHASLARCSSPAAGGHPSGAHDRGLWRGSQQRAWSSRPEAGRRAQPGNRPRQRWKTPGVPWHERRRVMLLLPSGGQRLDVRQRPPAMLSHKAR
jgi:hypothetical protein